MTERECLYCRKDGPFTNATHIVPAALGNDEDILVGVVCDRCNAYIGRKVEAPALGKTPIAVWRAILGVRNRRGRLPAVDLKLADKGRIPRTHSLSDTIGFEAHDDGSTSVTIDDDSVVRSILDGDKMQFNIVATPWHLVVMGRFLGKMGLEYLASIDVQEALGQRFDQIREYVRQGVRRDIWPVYWGSQGKIRDRVSTKAEQNQIIEVETECYAYSLGESIYGDHLFCFRMGTDLMMVCLDHAKQTELSERCVEGVDMQCLWYSHDEWRSRD